MARAKSCYLKGDNFTQGVNPDVISARRTAAAPPPPPGTSSTASAGAPAGLTRECLPLLPPLLRLAAINAAAAAWPATLAACLMGAQRAPHSLHARR